MATDVESGEIFAVNLAAIAREIAMDILPVSQILELHKIDDETWTQIQANPKFKAMLNELIREWNSAGNTKERIKVKAATGLEMQLEQYILDIADTEIPLAQRTEAGKFLAHLGELMGKELIGQSGGAFQIVLNIGATSTNAEVTPKPKIIDGQVLKGAIPD